MSDFGSHAMIYRIDGFSPSDQDELRVRGAAKKLQFTRTDRIGPYDEFDLRFGFGQDRDGTEGLSVGLSDYFIDDEEGNDGLEPDVIIARESTIAEQFAADLKSMLGEDYRVVAYCGYW